MKAVHSFDILGTTCPAAQHPLEILIFNNTAVTLRFLLSQLVNGAVVQRNNLIMRAVKKCICLELVESSASDP